MINIIISIDPSTQFLYGIIENLKSNSIPFNLIEVHPNEESYRNTVAIISKLEKEDTIIFLGHGQSDRLYGGEQLDKFPKKTLVKINEMGIFKNQYIFLLACDSSSLIKSSFRISKTIKSIGFGSLPTEMEEVKCNIMLGAEGITEKTIASFKEAIIETVSRGLIVHFKKGNQDFIYLKEFLNLLIAKRINKAILEDKDRNLGDFLYNMKNEMVIY